jgi:hypothetical protein
MRRRLNDVAEKNCGKCQSNRKIAAATFLGLLSAGALKIWDEFSSNTVAAQAATRKNSRPFIASIGPYARAIRRLRFTGICDQLRKPSHSTRSLSFPIPTFILTPTLHTVCLPLPPGRLRSGAKQS